MKVVWKEGVTINLGDYESYRLDVEIEVDSEEYKEPLTMDQIASEVRLGVRKAMLVRAKQVRDLASRNPDSVIHQIVSR